MGTKKTLGTPKNIAKNDFLLKFTTEGYLLQVNIADKIHQILRNQHGFSFLDWKFWARKYYQQNGGGAKFLCHPVFYIL